MYHTTFEPPNYDVGPLRTTKAIIKPPATKKMYANKAVIAAKIPFNLYRLKRIKPMAKNNANIPAKDTHIINIEADMNYDILSYLFSSRSL